MTFDIIGAVNSQVSPLALCRAFAFITIYFILVIKSLVICTYRALFAPSSAPRLQTVAYLVIAATSLFVTWYYITRFFIENYHDYISVDEKRTFLDWITHDSLFVRAYTIVTDTPEKWWWSGQLLSGAAALITFWSVEGQSAKISIREEEQDRTQKQNREGKNVQMSSWVATWWFAILGFFGSMSVGGPLFLAYLGSGIQSSSYLPRKIPGSMALLVLLGLLSVNITPYVPSGTKYFAVNLALAHIFYFVPSLQTFAPASAKVSLRPFYFLISFLSLLPHIYYSVLYLSDPSKVLSALWANNCQISISADLVFTSISAGVFIMTEARRLGMQGVGALLCTVMPIMSVSVILPFFLGLREKMIVAKEKKKE